MTQKIRHNVMTHCYSTPDLMPFSQAKNTLVNAVKKVVEVDIVNIDDSDKRIISEPVISGINVPAHNNSAMDGYALRDDNLACDNHTKTEFTLVGVAFAGAPFDGELNDGECIRIMTGAVVPKGANTVVMQENVRTIENKPGAIISLTQPAKYDSNIRKAGEDIKLGQTIFDVGYQIKAVDIGLLASLGQATVSVFRKVKVAVLATGNELKQPSQTLNEGDIYETNSQVLAAMLERANFDVVNLGIIPDDKQAIEQAFVHGDKVADVVISSGGVSVGDADYTKDVLDSFGKIEFWKVAIKPGKPFAFGHLPNSVFFGLPGNPVSATVTFHQLALPALQAMSGAQVSEPLILSATTTKNIRKRAGRMDFQRGIASIDSHGQLQVTPLSSQGSGILSSISKANCYVILEQENKGYVVGEQVSIQLFDSVLTNS